MAVRAPVVYSVNSGTTTATPPVVTIGTGTTTSVTVINTYLPPTHRLRSA